MENNKNSYKNLNEFESLILLIYVIPFLKIKLKSH